MNLRVPKAWVVVLAGTVAIAAFLFLYFLASFGGPTVGLSDPYKVTATIPDARALAPRSEVLVRGVRVGEVSDLEDVPDGQRVTIAVDDRYAPLRRDTTVGVGQKTLFGESFVDLRLGDPGAPALDSGDAIPPERVRPASVDIDEALSVLDAPARADLQTTLKAFGDGVAPDDSPERISQTLSQISRATSELRGVAQTLDGQEQNIAAGVNDGRTVLGALASREDSLREIVAGGRATLGALGDRSDSVRDGVAELPGLLTGARRTLHHARPLLFEARPLARDLARAAPPLHAALLDVPPVVRSADRLLAGTRQLNAAALPFLTRLRGTLDQVGPVAEPLGATLRNLQPIAAFLSARRTSVAAWFSNTGDLGSHRDAKGHFARFFVGFEPGTAFGAPGAFQNNAYTGPNDALANRPYSGYPRLRPYEP